MRKTITLFIIGLCFFTFVKAQPTGGGAQLPFIPYQFPVLWENFNPQTNYSALVPEASVADQFINAPSDINCHAYSVFLAMGQPVPPQPIGMGVGIIPVSVLNTMLSNGSISWGTKSNSTHIGWFTPGSDPTNFDHLQHSAIWSQFDAFPASEGYCQGVNGLAPPLAVHKVSTYTHTNGLNYDVKYFNVTGTIVPPNYQPITPSAIFSCDAFQMAAPDCNNGIMGEAAVVSSSTSTNSIRTWEWSNGVEDPYNENLTSGTHTVTVTESPSNYYCVASVTLEDQTSFFSHFTYTMHNMMFGCFNNYQGTGTATVNLASGYSINDFTIQWDQNALNQQGATATGLCNNSFTVTITSNITGCSETHVAHVPSGSIGGPTMGRKKSPGINTETNTVKTVIYPNPTKDILNLEGVLTNSEVLVLDLQGKIVLKAPLNSNSTINTHSLNNGIYILRVLNTAGEVINRKFSKF